MDALTPVAIVLILAIAGAVFFFIARRVLRLALKLAFATGLVLVIVVAATIGWWQGWFSGASSERRPTQTNQRTNTNRTRR